MCAVSSRRKRSSSQQGPWPAQRETQYLLTQRPSYRWGLYSFVPLWIFLSHASSHEAPAPAKVRGALMSARLSAPVGASTRAGSGTKCFAIHILFSGRSKYTATSAEKPQEIGHYRPIFLHDAPANASLTASGMGGKLSNYRYKRSSAALSRPLPAGRLSRRGWGAGPS